MDSDSLAYNSDNWLEISKVTILPFSPIFGAQNVLEFSQNYSYVCLPRLSRYMLLLELLASLCLLLDQDWNSKNCSASRNWISNEICIWMYVSTKQLQPCKKDSKTFYLSTFFSNFCNISTMHHLISFADLKFISFLVCKQIGQFCKLVKP